MKNYVITISIKKKKKKKEIMHFQKNRRIMNKYDLFII